MLPLYKTFTQRARMSAVAEGPPHVAPAQDIYIARAEGELELEEELYWALINIYRSPSVMFELTRVKPRGDRKKDD